MNDWSAVLADPFQTATDGPAGLLPDLDVPGNSARDLTGFAWTWDATNFYYSQSCAGASGGRQRFVVYVDTSADGSTPPKPRL